MAYSAYTGFERIIRHYASNGTTLKTADISSSCTHASFTLAAERGCCRGTLKMVADEMGAYALDHGDVIKMIPETGADAWYTGCVVGRERDATSGLHTYRLDGLAVRLSGLPVVDDADGHQFGASAGGSNPHPDRLYPHHPTAGVVQWIAFNTIDDANVGIITDGSGFDYTYMIYDEVGLLRYDPGQDCENVLGELARMVYDQQSSHSAAPYPILWGVDADRNLYFRFRPETQILRLHVGDANNTSGLPTLYLNGEVVRYQGWSESEGEDFVNVLVVRGNADSGGTIINETFEDTESIAKYGRRVIDFQEVPGLASSGAATLFAQGYFQRYADPKTTHTLDGVIITDKDQLPLPWSGYASIQDYQTANNAMAGRRTIQSVTVRFDDTPLAEIVIGEIEPSLFTPSSTATTRYAGNSWKSTQNRIPRVQAAAASSTEQMAHWKFVWNESE
ncbi:MAG: hypothetical protein M0R74_18190 [Dehalococcoidia bacterium]|nr:hypothetical protein [Dehalococcoidia bacterium]